MLEARRIEEAEEGYTIKSVNMPNSTVAFKMVVENLTPKQLKWPKAGMDTGMIVDAAPTIEGGYILNPNFFYVIKSP